MPKGCPVSLTAQTTDVTESVVVELPHEAVELVVPVIVRQNELLEVSAVADANFLAVGTPPDSVFQSSILNELRVGTSSMPYSLRMKSEGDRGDPLPCYSTASIIWEGWLDLVLIWFMESEMR